MSMRTTPLKKVNIKKSSSPKSNGTSKNKSLSAKSQTKRLKPPSFKQLPFDSKEFKPLNEFGGSLFASNTNPKTARPLTTKHAIHIVLRSEIARGEYSLLRYRKPILNIINSQASHFGIKIYELAVVGNHIHLLIYIQSNNLSIGRKNFSHFLRTISGLIARKVLGAERNAAALNRLWKQKFWSHRPYTRIVKGFKRSYKIVKDYIIQNHLEAIGLIPFQNRQKRKTSKTKAKTKPQRE